MPDVPSPRLVLIPVLTAAIALTACNGATAGDPTGAAHAASPAPTLIDGSVPPGGSTGPNGERSGPGTSSPSGDARRPGATRSGSRPPIVKNGSRDSDKVSLTFDADMTDSMIRQLANHTVASYANTRVLDLLEQQGVPATFFLTGQWVEQYPQVTSRITGNPLFEVANHSYEHMGFVPGCYTLPTLPPALMTSDVARTFDVLAPYGGRQTRYFRFPGGCYDDAAVQALAPLGVTVIQWDVVSGDPFATASAPIVRAVLTQVKPGSIVVMHVTEANAQYTDEALPEILAGIRDKGLRPVTLSEMLES